MTAGRLVRGRFAGWRRVVALAVATTVLPVSGCSFLFLDRPKNHYAPTEKIHCTTSYQLPGLDLGLAAAELTLIVIVASTSGSSPFSDSQTPDTAGQRYILSSLILNGASAIWGFYNVGECKELIAKDELGRMQPPVPPQPILQQKPDDN